VYTKLHIYNLEPTAREVSNIRYLSKKSAEQLTWFSHHNPTRVTPSVHTETFHTQNQHIQSQQATCHHPRNQKKTISLPQKTKIIQDSSACHQLCGHQKK
jgi:hypothetical protein